MAERLRAVVARLKEAVYSTRNVTSRRLSESQRARVDRLVAAAGASRESLNELAERLKNESFGKRVKDIVTKYEKFTGVQEIIGLQNTVVAAQDRFMAAQERRRDLGKEVASIEARLKELHAEMQNTMKGDDKYLHLCTEEHKLILQERALRQQFSEAEREERELFSAMSSAVKVGHERERAHAERNKYWYIVASILGTVLGIAGSTVNNHLKMAEFRELMEQQMARSAGVLYTVAGGTAAAGSAENIAEAMKTEFAYQDQLAQNMKTMQELITSLVNKVGSLMEHLNHHEHNIDVQLKDLKRLIVTASKASSTSDAELARVLAEVHHDLDDQRTDQEPELPKNRLVLEPSQIATGIGVVACLALILGSVLGKIS